MLNTWFTRVFTICLLTLTYGLSFGADQDDARKAASNVLALLHSGQYTNLWDMQTSAFFKSKLTKDSFLANMALGRQQLGNPVGDPKFVDMAYSQSDPSTGLKGEIYGFNFLTSYSVGNFYERIVVIKEQDGKFRMAGLWGAPASK
jgi:hypothetical protein